MCYVCKNIGTRRNFCYDAGRRGGEQERSGKCDTPKIKSIFMDAKTTTEKLSKWMKINCMWKKCMRRRPAESRGKFRILSFYFSRSLSNYPLWSPLLKILSFSLCVCEILSLFRYRHKILIAQDYGRALNGWPKVQRLLTVRISPKSRAQALSLEHINIDHSRGNGAAQRCRIAHGVKFSFPWNTLAYNESGK